MRATVSGLDAQNRARAETADSAICEKEDHNDAKAE
jgi:hypothetical protein